MSRDPVRAASQFFGGRVCLDFANTVDWRLSDAPQELIPDYLAMLAWSTARGTLSAATGGRLRLLAARRPDAASAVLQHAHVLRTDIWDAAEHLTSGDDARLEPFNRRLAELPPQPPLRGSGIAYVYDLRGSVLDEPLWPVLWSLAAVLTSDDARRIGICEAQGCGWFFIDESPNHARRWCSSEVCGNRERARRAYARRRVRDADD